MTQSPELVRCPWGTAPPENLEYHDLEWGRPVTDDKAIFEILCLEGFQAGLSWLTILRKRASFRAAFAGFDIGRVAAFGPGDVERLLQDSGIVRHRGKIEATVANARATVGLQKQGSSLAALLWQFEPPPPAAVRQAQSELPATTAESDALSKALRKRGFRFVGPTTVYSAMQALGVVNDHLESCYVWEEVERERASIARPTGAL
jgi:DNA-3-methyladenine glycosylase I